MVERKSEKAANVWFKQGRPVIADGERAGQRDTERITATVQIIPDDAFDDFGNRKLNGFTLDELKKCHETGEPLIIRNSDGAVTARVVIGNDDFSFTKKELKQIITEVEKTGVQLLKSPMDRSDLERLGQRRNIEEAASVRRESDTSSTGRKRTRKTDSGDSES